MKAMPKIRNKTAHKAGPTCAEAHWRGRRYPTRSSLIFRSTKAVGDAVEWAIQDLLSHPDFTDDR